MEKIKSLSDNRSIFPNGRSLRDTTNPAELNEEESLIAKTIEKFVLKQLIPNQDTLETHDYRSTRQLSNDAGELGLLGAHVPEAYGAVGMREKTGCDKAEQMGFSRSFIVAFNIHTRVGVLPYLYFGTEQQKQTDLPKLAPGAWIGAYA